MPGVRMMTRGDKGTIFVGTRAIGKVYAITDKGGERTHKVVLEGQQQPNGLAFAKGTLFVITVDKSLRLDGIEDKLDSPQVTDVSDKLKMPASDASQLEVFRPSAPTASSIRPSARPATCARSIPACTA